LQKHKHFMLTRLDTSQSVPVQVDRSGETRRVAWIIADPLEAGQLRRYRLSSATARSDTGKGVTVENDGKHLIVKVGSKPVLRYNHAVVPSPDPKTPYYARSGYIHPLFSPSGKIVTDDFNPDHAHQHGVMFAWRKSTFEGHGADCWNQMAGEGRVEHVKFEASGGGPVFGFFTARLRHVGLKLPGGPKPMLDETWYVRVFNTSDSFLFDLVSTQNTHGSSPLTVEKCHYGGFAIRGAAAWSKHRGRDHDFLTSQGKNKKDGNHTRPRWVDIHGLLDGQTSGVTIMDHPQNFRFPQPVRLHPYMPYFCFAPSVLGSFDIEQGKPFVSRYRLYVHDGKVEPPVVERLWHDYADPPVVRIVTDP
ncbi:MAG: PmoA family protein, partial [Pirellulales bacterium]|nr:PmoA family protein [Pirellulales bacterium]